jgi:hypothetical protein
VSFEELIHVQATSVSKREQKLSVKGVINISTKQAHETRRVVVSVPSGTDEHAVTEARDGGAAFKISAKPLSLARGVQSGPTHPGRAS